MPSTFDSAGRSRLITSPTLSPRSASGFRVIWMRPLLSVVFVPSMPMNDEMLATAGSCRDDAAERALTLGHRVERDVLRRLGDAQDDARVLDREQPLRHRDVEHERQRQGADRDDQGAPSGARAPTRSGPAVEGDQVVELALGGAREARRAGGRPRASAAWRRASASASARRPPRRGSPPRASARTRGRAGRRCRP